MGNQVDLHSCTDIFVYSNQGIGPDKGLLGWTYGARQGWTFMFTTMQRGCR